MIGNEVELFTSSTSAPTTSAQAVLLVDNPNADFFDGVILFFMVAAFIIWLFKKRT